MSLASVLTSPTLLLRLPSSEQTYTIHRSLLSATNLLASTKRHTTTLVLPANIPTHALERLLEYLYTNTYSPPSTPPPSAATSNPVFSAAAKGAIGVWDGPKPVIAPTQTNISTYESVHIPGSGNGYAQPPAAAAPVEPVLKKEEEVEVRVATPEQRLEAHLEVYRLAMGLEVKGLAEKVLETIRNEVIAKRGLVAELVREVYGTKIRDQALRDFVVGVVVGDWEHMKSEEAVGKLLREGGEFVVDLVSRVKGF